MSSLDAEGGNVQFAQVDLNDIHVLLLAVIDSLPDLIYVTDVEGRFLLDNLQHRRFLGATSMQEVVGKTLSHFVPNELAEHERSLDLPVLQTGQPLLNCEREVTTHTGQRIWVSSTKISLRNPKDGVVGIVGCDRDITERRRSEKALAQEQDLLYALMDNIPDTIYFKDPQSRFTRVNRAQAGLLGLQSPDQAIGRTDFDFFEPEHAQTAFADEQRILRSGQALIGKIERIRRADGEFRWVTATKVPVHDARGNVTGLVGISRDVTERVLAEQEAARYGAALREKNAQLELDLSLARDVQQAFLPQRYPQFSPDPNAVESSLRFCHRYQPSAQVGGDFFDVLNLGNGCVGVLICDVMGKGLRAALVTAMMRTMVLELSPLASDPGRFLTAVSRDLLATLGHMQQPIFVSAFYMVADSVEGVLQYATAGHPSPLHLRHNGATVEPLVHETAKHGPVLGLFEEAVYETERHPLAMGDRVVLFTDGVYEVDDPSGEQYGVERLLKAVRRRLNLPTEAMFDDLLSEIRQFSAGREFADDVCLVGMEVARVGR